jgi:hypothetical protein
MDAFSTADYACMQATAEASFFDTCQLAAMSAHSWGSADTGPGTATWGAAQPCGYSPAPVGETKDGAQVPIFDAVLRLPFDTDVTGIQRVRITHRHGVALAAAEEYTVTGKPARGPSALLLELKLVTGNTVT